MPSYTDTVLSALYQGETLRVSFSSSQEREAFRKMLYRAKAAQDVALETLLGEKKKVLSFQLATAPELEEYFLAIISLQDRVRDITFKAIKETDV